MPRSVTVRDRVPRPANAGADERRQAPPGAEIEVSIEHEHFRGVRAVILVEAGGAARTEFVIAADHLELRRRTILASGIEAQPIVDLIADAEIDEDGIVGLFCTIVQLAGHTKLGIGLEMIERSNLCTPTPTSPRRYQPELEPGRLDSAGWIGRAGEVGGECHRAHCSRQLPRAPEFSHYS